MRAKFIRFDGVEAMRRNERELLCRIDGREFWVPCDDIALDDGVVQRPGDCGALVLTKAAAVKLGLLPPETVIAAAALDAAPPDPQPQ
jgi:hypothetical protein